MTMLRRLLLLSLFIGASLLVSLPAPWNSHAYAQETTDESQGSPSAAEPKTGDAATGEVVKCSGIPEAQGGVLLGAIIPCMTHTIEKSTIRFAAEMVRLLQPLLYTFLLLVVTLFGVRLVQQEPNIHRQGFLLLVKIAIVAAILSDLGGTGSIKQGSSESMIIPSVYKIMNESQAVIIGALDTGSLTCDVAKYTGPNTPKTWATMDCILGKLFGFTTGTDPATGAKTTNMLLASSMFGLLTGFLFGGTWGVVVFFALLGVLVSLFMLVGRMAMAFITGYLTICLMLIIAPLFMPLIFMNVTKGYFDGVWKNILAGFIMPLMITAYATFALLIYDKMLFALTSMVQNLFKHKIIKDALEAPRKVCDKQITGDHGTVRLNKPRASEAELSPIMKLPQMMSGFLPNLWGANDPCGLAKVPTLNIKNINDPKFKEGKETIEKLFNELLALFILGFLLQAGLSRVSDLVVQLAGSASAGLAYGRSTQFDSKFTGAVEEARRSAMEGVKRDEFKDKNFDPQGKTGADFMKALPGVTRDSSKSFMAEIKR